MIKPQGKGIVTVQSKVKSTVSSTPDHKAQKLEQ